MRSWFLRTTIIHRALHTTLCTSPAAAAASASAAAYQQQQDEQEQQHHEQEQEQEQQQQGARSVSISCTLRCAHTQDPACASTADRERQRME
eukprot:1295217-Rhodomonas_salina.1